MSNMSVVVCVALGLVYCFMLGFLTQSLAQKKGHGGYFWTGFFFGIFGLIYVAGLPTSGPAYVEAHDDLAKRIAAEIKK